MIFLSMLLRQNIYDTNNQRVGVVRDVCVNLHETFPVVTALVISSVGGSTEQFIPWSQIRSIEEPEIHLNVPQSDITSYIPDEYDLLLKRDILDKQIVDTQGFRVVKVNDLKLVQIKQTARLVGVDIGFSGLMRRLGLQPLINTMSRVLPVQFPERTITWNYVEPIQMVHAGTGPLVTLTGDGSTVGASAIVPHVQLNVSQSRLAELHPADLADILEQLDIGEAGAMLGQLDTETAADTLNEVTYARQSELLNELSPERASDLLELMPPDDAADILAKLPDSEAEHLLELMPASESRPIRDLLRYEASTAGGIMTNEVLALAQESTIEEVLAYLRQHSSHLEMVYYLYVIDEERHLKGVVSLRQLVTAEPGTQMQDLLDPDVIYVQTTTDQEEVARIIAKYDLLGVPVVDDGHHLVGLVTVDDIIDVIHEEQTEDLSEIAGVDIEEIEEEPRFSWRSATSRFSWLAVNLVAGFLMALIIYQIFQPVSLSSTKLASLSGAFLSASSLPLMGSLICFIPMLLLTSGSASSQTLAIAGWQLRIKQGRDFWRGFLRELQLGTVGGILTSLLSALLSWTLFRSPLLSLIIGLSFGCTLLIATICAMLLPNLFQRIRLRGSLLTAPLLNPIIALISLSSFFAVTLLLANVLKI